jgi:hypothetical protein
MHRQDGSDGELLVAGMDFNTPRRALAGATEMRAASDDSERTLEYAIPAGPTGFAPPRLELLSTTTDVARGVRTITLRAVGGGAFRLRLRAPSDRIAGWSIPTPPPARRAGLPVSVDYVAPPDTGWRFSIDVLGAAPIPLELSAIHLRTTPAAGTLMRALPSWTDTHAVAVNEGSWRY